MQDNALITILITAIKAGLTVQGLTANVVQDNQPTPQPDASIGNDTIYVVKINDKPRGNPGQSTLYVDGIMKLTEIQLIETRFQIQAAAIQNPANQAQTTAADYVNAVVLALQSLVAIAVLQAQGVGILRIDGVATTYFDNDLGSFEASPRCEVILGHTKTLIQTIPSTLTLKPNRVVGF